jgi:hypothetical protein
MSEHTLIPRTIKEFNTYITQTNTYLVQGAPTNASRFNWTAADLSGWQAILAKWNPKFQTYSDKKGSYTTDTRNDLMGIINSAVSFAKTNKLIELVRATVGLTALDCSTFRLPATLATGSSSLHQPTVVVSKEKTVITVEGVYPKLIPELGGFVHIKAYSEKEQVKRPRKLAGFDLVEYAVGVFYSGTANLPVHAEDPRLTIGHSTKANFVLLTVGMNNNLPALSAGAVETVKIAVFFFRWAKSKHPNLDGPWSGPFSTPLH